MGEGKGIVKAVALAAVGMLAGYALQRWLNRREIIVARQDAPRVTEDGAVVYRAPYTTKTVVIPADVVAKLAGGRPLREGVLWEILAKAREQGLLV